jgi:hypothetical protein
VGSVDVFGSHQGAHFKKAKREPNAMMIDGTPRVRVLAAPATKTGTTTANTYM